MGERLRVAAEARRTTSAALTRQAVLQMLGVDESQARSLSGGGFENAPACSLVKVTLRMSAVHAASLAVRARAVDQSQGRYVSELLEGSPPPPKAADHASAVAALIASNDRLATLSADLNAFLRVLGRSQLTELERYRGSLVSLTSDVRRHLECASALIADIKPARRGRQ
jgi:hypothetical protein